MALGVILYEALTGRPPFRGDSPLETLLQVQSAEPLSPARLRPKVPRDLETICLKCLEKDPRKRYASAADLADDLQRYLATKPILARPVGTVAQAWRWCQRKPTVAALAAALAVVVLASLAGLTYLWLRAEHLGDVARDRQHDAEVNLGEANRQQQRAQQSYQLARASLEECVTRVAEDPRLARGPLEDLRKTALQAETQFYERFVALQGTEPDFQAERGVAFSRLGLVTADLGDQKQANAYFRQAQEILTPLVAAHPTHPKYRAALATCCHQKAKLSADMGDLPAAEETAAIALTIYQALAQEFPADSVNRLHLAGTHANLGAWSLRKVSQASDADPATRTALANASQKSLKMALDILDELRLQQPNDPGLHHRSASVSINLGNLHQEMGQMDDAVRCLELARTMLDNFLRDHAGHEDVSKVRASMANALSSLANVHLSNQQPKKAEQAYHEALAITQKLAHDHPLVWSHAVYVGNIEGNIGNLLRLNGDASTALTWFDRAIATLQPLQVKQPRDRESRAFLCSAQLGSAAALIQLKRDAEALPRLDRALELDDGRFRLMGRLARAQSLARVKEHVRATEEANALVVEMKIAHPGILICAARTFACAAAAVTKDDPLAEQYAARAMKHLQQSLAAGYQGVDVLRADPDLEYLRTHRRDEFEKLLREWQLR